jgi:hypothetical protein
MYQTPFKIYKYRWIMLAFYMLIVAIYQLLWITLGFFLLGSGPIGFQYGAEITYPASEGPSNGLLLLIGQISGIAMIFGLCSFKSPLNGSMTKPLFFLIGLMAVSIFLSTCLKEST